MATNLGLAPEYIPECGCSGQVLSECVQGSDVDKIEPEVGAGGEILDGNL